MPLEQAVSYVAEAKRLLGEVRTQIGEATSLRDARAAWLERTAAVHRTGDGSALKGNAAAHLSMTMLQFLLDQRFRADHDQFAFLKTAED